jgi:threonylcarbamoyladenosine tRNA methylthiotransferase MtaB
VKSQADFYVGYSIGDRTRAFLKVQDGCDYKCTYCTIPLARGFQVMMSGKCVEKCKDISRSKHQGNCFDWCEYWRLKGEFGIKNNYHSWNWFKN